MDANQEYVQEGSYVVLEFWRYIPSNGYMSTKEVLRRSGTSSADLEAFTATAVSIENCVTSVARANISSKIY